MELDAVVLLVVVVLLLLLLPMIPAFWFLPFLTGLNLKFGRNRFCRKKANSEVTVKQ